MLLTVAQLPPPANWTETPSNPFAPNPLDRCKPPDPPTKTGKAQSGDFQRRNDPALFSEEIGVSDSPARVSAALDAFPTEITCVTRGINAGQANDSDFVYSNAAASRLNVTNIGDRTDAYRITFHIKPRVQQAGAGGEDDVYVDVVLIQTGRAGIAVQALGIGAPYDGQALLVIATRAEAAARQALQ
jgi:hypothetical protein